MDITVDHVSKAFEEYAAIDDVSVRIPGGELVALLGPSGSGKTTLLRIIAGIEAPDRGTIRYGDVDVTDHPIQARRIGFVFQDYALFDHMTVGDNIAFGLAVRKAPKAQTTARVRDLLARVQLTGLDNRLPRELSGGQRQRVALARALAPDPKVLLLDEPFGALDARVRAELRGWLRRLHDDLHLTSIFVTHDQAEALEVADRIVVMNHGRIEQVGEPSEVFDAPASAFVMDFLGGVNVLDGEVTEERGVFGALELPWAGPGAGAAQAFVRSHDLVLQREAGERGVPVTVEHVHRIGVGARVIVRAGDHDLTAELPHHAVAELGLVRGAHLFAHVRAARIFLRSAAGERRVTPT